MAEGVGFVLLSGVVTSTGRRGRVSPRRSGFVTQRRSGLDGMPGGLWSRFKREGYMISEATFTMQLTRARQPGGFSPRLVDGSRRTRTETAGGSDGVRGRGGGWCACGGGKRSEAVTQHSSSPLPAAAKGTARGLGWVWGAGNSARRAERRPAQTERHHTASDRTELEPLHLLKVPAVLSATAVAMVRRRADRAATVGLGVCGFPPR